MTKLLTLMLLALVATNYNNTVAQTADDAPIAFPDSLFKARLLDTSRHSIDTNKDREISIAEARNYTDSIDVSRKDWHEIKDLTGIEHFTNITSLDCSRNSLTSLDVSHNKELEKLICVKNSLTRLNVSKNTALKELYCMDNSLTHLDVSHNKALEYLNCSDNSLTSLDVSKNEELMGLGCAKNPLTSLDVSKNAKLKELYCKGNNIRCISVTKGQHIEKVDKGDKTDYCTE